MGISREEQRRLARNEANKLRRRVVLKAKRCAACQNWFRPKRRDAMTCGDACRQALHRASRER